MLFCENQTVGRDRRLLYITAAITTLCDCGSSEMATVTIVADGVNSFLIEGSANTNRASVSVPSGHK